MQRPITQRCLGFPDKWVVGIPIPNARYYFVRVARLDDYLRNTPKWVLELKRSVIE